ncbi:VOC family protein [Gammaproteobacteria bacterium]|nr:VOC family protein [Gammaproteobacteria bacterium]
MVLVCSPVTAKEIDFTRYLSDHGFEKPNSENSFRGTKGEGRLIISGALNTNVTVVINGETISLTDNITEGKVEFRVELLETNTIVVDVTSPPSTNINIRVKQRANIELNVQERVHFNTNVSNFVQAREFYGKLGFETVSGFPDTNTQAMARAIGIETPTDYDGSKGEHAGGYLLHGELIGAGGFWGGVIDLIEFTIPRNLEAPYAQVNHLGMARAAMHTTNIAADYQYMTSMGVEFLSGPTERYNGTLFAIFKDLDGTFYELIEVDGEDTETDTTHITSLGHVNINVSDLERSNAWYQMFGYEVTETLPSTESMEVARAMGFEQPFTVKGNRVTHDVDGSVLELVQWLTPFDPERAYPAPVNHLGIHRTAYSTTNIEADVAALKAQGVEFLSPVTPCCSGDDSSSSIIAFYDPDGTVVELVQQPYVFHLLFKVVTWFEKTF